MAGELTSGHLSLTARIGEVQEECVIRSCFQPKSAIHFVEYHKSDCDSFREGSSRSELSVAGKTDYPAASH